MVQGNDISELLTFVPSLVDFLGHLDGHYGKQDAQLERHSI